MENKSKIAFEILIIIIICLIAFIIFRKPEIIITSGKEQLLEDSIALLTKTINKSEIHQHILEEQYDSLLNLDPKIIIRTNEKIKFIYSTATPSELDSIIRTNWKTNLRYR